MTDDKPQLLATVFSDYICPFCYVGDARLNRLREHYDLKVNWCFLEIHPDTDAAGESVTELGYQPETWQRMMATLDEMAKEEGLALADHDFTTNSRQALLLAEAAKLAGADVFYRLHNRLFEAYLVEGLNIGEETVLRKLAEEAGMPADIVASAWRDARFEQRLQHNRQAAEELAVEATPTIFIGDERFNGAVPYQQLLEAARTVVQPG